jgi:hypothetical protein
MGRKSRKRIFSQSHLLKEKQQKNNEKEPVSEVPFLFERQFMKHNLID